MDYRLKEVSMQNALSDYVAPVGYRSSYKGVPFGRYAEVLRFIDFTKYFVMFRGPRPRFNQNIKTKYRPLIQGFKKSLIVMNS